MIEGIIGKKIGMSQVFDGEGNVVPVTVIQAGPCTVIQKKTLAKDGYVVRPARPRRGARASGSPSRPRSGISRSRASRS